MAEIESGAQSAQAALRRYPDYAWVIAEAWSQATTDVIQRLRSGQGTPARLVQDSSGP